MVDRFRAGDTVIEALVDDDPCDTDISRGCLSFQGAVEEAVVEMLGVG